MTHRIREVKYSTTGKLIGYVTYGINTDKNDQSLVQPESVIGQYVGKIPELGSVFAFLKTPRGFFLGVITPSVLLIIYFSIAVGKILGRKEAVADIDIVREIASLKQRIVVLESEKELAVAKITDLGSTKQSEYAPREIKLYPRPHFIRAELCLYNSFRIDYVSLGRTSSIFSQGQACKKSLIFLLFKGIVRFSFTHVRKI